VFVFVSDDRRREIIKKIIVKGIMFKLGRFLRHFGKDR